MEQTLHDYIYDYSDYRILFFHTFPGSGKTFTTMKTLMENDCMFIYTAPTHSLGREMVADPYDILQVKSRRHFCNDPRFRDLERYNINTSLLCENFCPDKDQCEYYLRIKELFQNPQSWCGVHHHFGNLVQSYLDQHGDCVDCIVVDEEFLQSLYVQLVIGERLLKWTVNMLDNFPDSPEKQLIVYILKEISWAIQTGRTNDIDYDQIKSDVLDYGDRYKFINMDSFLFSVDELLLDWLINEKPIKKNIVNPLFRMARYYYYNREKPGYLESMLNVGYSKKRDKYYCFLHRYDLDYVRIDGQKMVVLDATTPVGIYEKIFDKEIRVISYGKFDDAACYQFTGYPTRNRFPMSSLVTKVKDGVEYSGGFYRLTEILKGICQKHWKENILVVSRKKFDIKDKIAEILGEDGISVQVGEARRDWDGSRVVVEHFGRLRGENRYSDFRVAVIFGTPFPNPQFIARQSVLLGIDQEKLIELSREMEIIQDLYRIRPHDKEKAWFYVLTSIDLGFQVERKLSPGKFEDWVWGRKPIVRSRTITKERIRADILETFKKWDSLKKTEVRERVTGSNRTVGEVFEELKAEGFFDEVRQEGGRGRPTSKYKIKWDVLGEE